jgi:23S rRNA (guanine745-N1)-methyltransferase
VYACARGHSYDIARTGYVNLLQPQDRRSRDAGDSREAVDARARLLAHGVGTSLIDAIVARFSGRSNADVIVDLGSGSGDVLGAIARAGAATCIGIDLSTAASEYAARRFPTVTWVVANADRRLPLLDQSVDAVISVHGRRNPSECARVMARNAELIVAVPGPDDLIELRETVQGERHERDRSAALEAEYAPFFSVIDRFYIREQRELPPDELRDLLRGTYRGERISVRKKIEALDSLRVTLSSSIVVFERNRP